MKVNQQTTRSRKFWTEVPGRREYHRVPQGLHLSLTVAATTCTLCAAVIFSTLDSAKKSRFHKTLASKNCENIGDAAKFFMLVCRSSPL